MFSSTIKDSQVNNNNNIVFDSNNTNIENLNTLNIENVVLSGIQGQELESLQQPLVEVENRVREISEKLEGNERVEILKWLSKVDYKEHHDYISSARQANTGNWLFRKPDFIQWNNSSSSIFWLHGIAGAGKTVLASSVIDMPRPKNHALTYFYCKYGEIDRQGPQSFLSTIVKQLSLLSPEGFLPKAVISLYEQLKKEGVDLESRRLNLGKSTELVRELSKAFEQTVIIVDALDECDKETRHQLMAALKNLRSSTQRLKIFITSRNDDDIRIQFENESEVFIQQSDNSKDIKLFVMTEVGKYISAKRLLGGKVRPELKQAIIATLIKGAGGMFLWVRFQLEHICKEKSDTAILKALQRLPKDLEATYSVIWGKILADTDDNRLLAQRTLKWIICAKRPLTMPEIIEATSVTPMQWAETSDHGSVTYKTFLDVCQNLVVVDEELGVLRTAHFSVTEFLLKTISSSEAHTAAAEICLTLLCSENHLSTSRRTEENTLDNYTLRDYVMENWAEHIRLSGDGSSALSELQKTFLKPSPAYSKWLQAASKDKSDLRSKDDDKQLNPLWVACYFQLWDMLKFLLGDSPDCTMRNCKGMMPIHLIAQHGYSVGGKLLLGQKGVRLNAKTDKDETPLLFAASNGRETIVRLLLGMNSAAETDGGRIEGKSAARGRVMSIFRRLLNGVLVNAKTKYGWTPLYVAAGNGHEGVVRLLLEQKGVLVNAKTKKGQTPRDVTAINGHVKIVKLLDEAMAAREGNTSGRE